MGPCGLAVTRLASERTAVAAAGLRLEIEQVLAVGCAPSRRSDLGAVTTNPQAFLRGRYDVVIEAGDAAEPARTLVAALLKTRIPVVTANRALAAKHRSELEDLAATHGVSFRCEATLPAAAVPLLSTLASRPLAAAIDRIVAVVDGAANRRLSALADVQTASGSTTRRRHHHDSCEPGTRGDGEPDAETLLLLASICGWGSLDRATLEVHGSCSITARDAAAAKNAGGAIKPVIMARRTIVHDGESGTVEAFVGPAFLPSRDPLGVLNGPFTGIRLEGRYAPQLFLSGPDDIDVTAATLLDEALQVVLHRPAGGRPARCQTLKPAIAPVTPWFALVTFPGVTPPDATVVNVIADAGLTVERLTACAADAPRSLLVGAHSRVDVDAATARLHARHRIHVRAFRRFESR